MAELHEQGLNSCYTNLTSFKYFAVVAVVVIVLTAARHHLVIFGLLAHPLSGASAHILLLLNASTLA